MPWIDLISPKDATGRLRKIFDASITRAGKVFNVIAIQGLQPKVLDASTRLYTRIMKSPDEPLTRAQREMIAVTVSRTNACGY